MDALQDKAQRHVLAITSAYLASPYCQHEMDRALACDPKFEKNIVLPVRRENVALPARIVKPNPLYVDLRNDRAGDQWNLLLDGYGADLGVTAPDWLSARDQVRRDLRRGQSVNLITGDGANWNPMLQQIAKAATPKMPVIGMENPDTIGWRGLVAEILRSIGISRPVPEPDEDLAELRRGLNAVKIAQRNKAQVALTHFDLAYHRWRDDINLFTSLRFFIMIDQNLTLLIQSRAPFGMFLPSNHPLSTININTVELR